MSLYIPSLGAQIEADDNGVFQSSPLLSTYSPRLFGSPPQLTNLCDMRLASSDGDDPGPVGDFYLNRILKDAQIANFCVGRAMFTGGMSSLLNVIRVTGQYMNAVSKYGVVDKDGNVVTQSSGAISSVDLESYKASMGDNSDSEYTMTTAGALGLDDLDEDASVINLYAIEGVKAMIDGVANLITHFPETLASSILTSLSVQQPFYTFESDWFTYINNVKMMIDSAIVMLGLQNAVVRIGDTLYPIGTDAKVNKDTDVWSNYRFITTDKNLGMVTGIDKQNGDSTQYVSFMIDPSGHSESYSNQVGESQIYASVINSGSNIGREIAFITNSSASSLDDAILNLAGKSVNIAEAVLSNLGGGIGRFTAGIAGSMAKSFVGDHTIYPLIFQDHTSTQTKELTIHLVASSGNPYCYLTEVLVPLFFLLGMALPQMSKNNASAYSFPPIIQCSIPGLWGTRLGMVTNLTVNKNPSSKDFSYQGFPLSIDVTMTITDLQHTLMTSPLNKASLFLNNRTMFDYIAQCSGVDKYRINGSIRLVTRLALAASVIDNAFYTLGSALPNDLTTGFNRLTGLNIVV